MTRFFALFLSLLLILSLAACGDTRDASADASADTSAGASADASADAGNDEADGAQSEQSVPAEDPARLTEEEALALLEQKYGTEDKATGNIYSFGLESVEKVDGKTYYNFRWSWLVDGDHLSYLTNLFVAEDGSAIIQALPSSDGGWELFED